MSDKQDRWRNRRHVAIGITTMIERPVEGNVGVGFAVPINIAKQQLTQLEGGATLEQGYLGISVQEVANPNQSGVAVAAAATGSGAAAAGLRADDIITAVDGAAITGYDDLAAQLAGKQPGTKVTLAIQRVGPSSKLSSRSSPARRSPYSGSAARKPGRSAQDAAACRWISQHAAGERRIAWLALDAGDSDTLRFLRYRLYNTKSYRVLEWER